MILLAIRQRRDPPRDAILGALYEDERYSFFTLERLSLAIPSGTYPVTLTPSARCASGRLWSPRQDHVLPLIGNVPGREGIRIHAANDAHELEGCVAVGLALDGATLEESRAALSLLMAKIAMSQAPVWLTIREGV